MDTIFALATARGRAGVAIVRVSGPQAASVSTDLCGTIPTSRGVRAVKDGPDGELIDEALILVFAAGSSFTGEPVVEFHLHGSDVIVQRLFVALGRYPGLRMAEAGEFTRRAMENGRLDLAQVEGLADLIDAETEAQHRQALRVFSGELGGLVEDWRTKLIRAAALVEATIDFADEDVPMDVSPEVHDIIDDVSASIEKQRKGVGAAERVRDGFIVAIVGEPNVGKSTLINNIVQREIAITSDIPGTTRDVLEARVNIGGFAVTLLDTAGLRDSNDPIEAIGVAKALERAQHADIRVLLIDDKAPEGIEVVDGDIVLKAKADLVAQSGGISGLTGEGVGELLQKLENRMSKMTAGAGVAVRERHRIALANSLEHLARATELLQDNALSDITAAELRFALRELESLIGRVDVEDFLDEIFMSFCIGK